MIRSRVLIIEQDEWETAVLRKSLSEAGFEVYVSTEARAGFDRVRQLLPDCILCGVNLPDIDGFWVVRRVRSERSPVHATPFVLLAEPGDAESRLLGLQVGADMCWEKPCRATELVAQVGALIDMALRLRQQRPETPLSERPASLSGAAFHGDVAQMSLATVLTVLELERRTGRLRIMDGAGKTVLVMVRLGALTHATLDGRSVAPTPLLRDMLRWKSGHFWFRNDHVSERPEASQGISGLLLEAMRLEDEAQR